MKIQSKYGRNFLKAQLNQIVPMRRDLNTQ